MIVRKQSVLFFAIKIHSLDSGTGLGSTSDEQKIDKRKEINRIVEYRFLEISRKTKIGWRNWDKIAAFDYPWETTLRVGEELQSITGRSRN